MNLAILAGHVGQEPRTVGDSGISLRIATNEKGKDGKEYTSWHDVVCFGYLTDRARQVSKGDSVLVVGRIQTRKVQKDDGSTTYFTSVVANQLNHTPKTSQEQTVQPEHDEHMSLGF